VDLLIVCLELLFRACVNPERSRIIVFKVFDIVEYQLRLSSSAKAANHKDLARSTALLQGVMEPLFNLRMECRSWDIACDCLQCGAAVVAGELMLIAALNI
jgi:hypothetical protein